jgi:tetratricopeptide (TPR) repeat protein
MLTLESKSSMTKSKLSFAALLGLALLVAAPAYAKEKDGGDKDKDKSDLCQKDAACRQHSDEGHKLFSDRKYSEALTEFQRAYDIAKEPRILLNIGRTLFRLGRPKAALRTFEQYQKDAPADPDTQAKVERYIAEAKIAVEAERQAGGPEEKNPDQVTPPPVVPQLPVTPPEEKKPVYKKWWFWTAIGGAAVAVGLGVGLGVGLTRPPSATEIVWR